MIPAYAITAMLAAQAEKTQELFAYWRCRHSLHGCVQADMEFGYDKIWTVLFRPYLFNMTNCFP
ncbi:hypothetical protein LPU83_pLPU83c_0075 (plasmid) [Rhizobium favelukesii]|uniref:Uncharacterized protein n=1 Tax=Rhizobium favelukesii TaxID=348824 RepID=W6RHI1_9HYPH|nr:hypothetical protein LPU83_pLPU83c_0075 [Rhizobium favelukesii]